MGFIKGEAGEMVGEILTIVPPIIVNENSELESCGDVTAYPSEDEVYAHFEEWFADEAHFAVDSRGQIMKLFNVPGLGLRLRGFGEPDRPELFRRYFLSIQHRGDPEALAQKEGSLTQEEIRRQAMDYARAEAEWRKAFTIRRWLKEVLGGLWMSLTRRG